MSSIGEFIQEARFTRKLSVKELSEESGLSYGTIRAYEQNRRTPSVESFHKLLVALEIEGLKWTNSQTWIHPDTGVEYTLAPFASGRPKRSEVRTRNFAQKQVAAVKSILSFDEETLDAILVMIQHCSYPKE
jgi:transcriptional regulator with XRE-family HTH domain